MAALAAERILARTPETSSILLALQADQGLLAERHLGPSLLGDAEDFELADGQGASGAHHRADRFEVVALRGASRLILNSTVSTELSGGNSVKPA